MTTAQVRVLYIARGVGKHEIVDDAWVRAKYGIPARAYVDYATLRGDASDGLPGVAGIGEKTAASLLNAHGDLEGILAEASRPQQQDQRLDRGQARRGDRLPGGGADRGRRWPAISTSASAGTSLICPPHPAKPELFAELTELLGLGSSADRILASLAGAAG